MVTLEEYTYRTPKYKVEIFNSTYSWDDSRTALTSISDKNSGWYSIPESSIGLNRLQVKDSLLSKPTATLHIYNDELEIFTMDMIMKYSSDTELPKTPENASNLNEGKLLVMISDENRGSPDTIGTVTISGNVGGSADTEVINISGTGAYLSTKDFQTITNVSESGLSCDIAVFGNTGVENGVREIRISVDCNDDDTYGIIFGGYMQVEDKKVFNAYDLIKLECSGYQDFLMSNQFITGNRAKFRCTHYSKTGETGDCAEKASGDAAVKWQSICWIGEAEVKNPDGTLAHADYRCSEYSAGTELLNYCPWTFNPDYNLDTESSYEDYPTDYLRMMYAIKEMSKNLDDDVRSRDFDLIMDARMLLNDATGINTTDTTITYDNLSGTITDTKYILIDNEWMKISSHTGTTMTVVRGQLGSAAASHSDNAIIKLYKLADTSAAGDDVLLTVPNIGGTIHETGQDLARTIEGSTSSNRLVFWVDHLKQLQLTELNIGNVGYTTNLEITEDNIEKVSKLNKTAPINVVTSWVKPKSGGNELYCRKEDATSIGLFGVKTKQIKNQQLNAIGTDNKSQGLVGFETFATAYLRNNAYPRVEQTLDVSYFVPDEHYWNLNYDPLLTYSDEVNNYIDIKGTKVDAPDYSIEGNPKKTFVITGVEYLSESYGNLLTRLTMERLTTASDYT